MLSYFFRRIPFNPRAILNIPSILLGKFKQKFKLNRDRVLQVFKILFTSTVNTFILTLVFLISERLISTLNVNIGNKLLDESKHHFTEIKWYIFLLYVGINIKLGKEYKEFALKTIHLKIVDLLSEEYSQNLVATPYNWTVG